MTMMYRILVLAGALLAPIPAFATGENGDLFIQLAEQVSAGHGKPLFAEELYVEKTLPGSGDISVFGAFHVDKNFRSAYAGVGKRFGDLQVAIGVGSARFDETSHLTVNPWIYYSKDGLEGYLSAEHYGNEKIEPWFFTGYVHKDVTEKVFVGVYGESGFGIGPMIGTSLFNEKLKVWATLSAMNRQEEGARVIFGILYNF